MVLHRPIECTAFIGILPRVTAYMQGKTMIFVSGMTPRRTSREWNLRFTKRAKVAGQTSSVRWLDESHFHL
jgi:hypothetical protein